MKRKMIVVCLIGLVAAVGARAADESTTPPTGEHRSPQGGVMGLLPLRLLEKLELTADQKTKYDTLNASFKKDAAKLQSAHSSSGESSSAGSTNSISASHESPNREGLHKIRKGYIDQFRASLTATQSEELDKALENMRSNHGNHNGANAAPKPPADNS